MNNLQFAFRPFLHTLANEVFERQSNETAVTYKPAANVSEDENKYTIELALPGFSKEEVSIKFEEEILTVTAGRQPKEDVKGPKYTWNEFGFKSKYERSFQLPETVDADNISAAFENGILNISLPKKEVQPSAVKEITIA
ncbi:MAG: Hsp20/alpha crystallin family protein [Bacteroidales bacterium]|nr:Hsp20/alpha crystallin family protein [Bacteroidales bacterium]